MTIIKELNTFCNNTLISHLGIEFIDAGKDFLVARMPVDQRTVQPQGILHGGASMALAETVGSAASYLLIDKDKYYVVGLEINGNHVSSATKGFVTATASLLHHGKRTHVWDIKIRDEDDCLISVGRITNMVVEINNV